MKKTKIKKIGWSAIMIATICILLFPSGMAIDHESVSDRTISIEENNLPDCVTIDLSAPLEWSSGFGGRYTCVTFRSYRYLDDSCRLRLYGSEFIDWYWTPTDGRTHFCNTTLYVEVWITDNSNGELMYGIFSGSIYTEWWDPGTPYFFGYPILVYLADTVNFTMEKMHWHAERQVDDYPMDIYDRTFNKYIFDFDTETHMSSAFQVVHNLE